MSIGISKGRTDAYVQILELLRLGPVPRLVQIHLETKKS